MTIPIKKIREELERALRGRGVEEKMISIVVNDYLEGELLGIGSHGLMAFPSFLEIAHTMKGKEEHTLKETHSMIMMDANTLPGVYVGMHLADRLMKKAETEGVAVGYIINMMTWLRPGSIAQYVADQGMVALVINNGGIPMMAPPGGYDPVIGTNPIGIGIPSDFFSVVVDMATSKRAWGEARKAKEDGENLPKNTFYTRRGEYAVDPDDAYSVEAAGGYKGFALALFIEMMTGSFLGQGMGEGEVPTNQDYQVKTRGGIIVIFNPALITNTTAMCHANSELLNVIKKGHTLAGSEGITIPGEKQFITRQMNLKRGTLEVDDVLWNKICSHLPS